MNNRVERLMHRLFCACCRLPDYGGDLWSRGLDVIQRKTGSVIYLSRFEPSGMTEGEAPTAQITIKRE